MSNSPRTNSLFLPFLLVVGALFLKGGSKSGKMIAPVKGKIGSGFGKRTNPKTKKEEFHNGIDISAPLNTPIVSPEAGTIVSVSPLDAKGLPDLTEAKKQPGGLQVIIKHSNGFRTGYAHLNKAVLKKGDSVAKGETFAYSGNTGSMTTGPHLHFTMKDDKGVLVDARKYIDFDA